TPASNGATTFVVMNASGDSGVTAQLAIGYKSDTVFPLSLASIALGIVLIALGIWIALRRRRSRRKTRPPAAAMPEASPAPMPAAVPAPLAQPASPPAQQPAPDSDSETKPEPQPDLDEDPKPETKAEPPLQGWYRDEDNT
ncbi:hypothetical protein N9D66_01090, partial [Candidatus Nanopelagicales bacterium]|nr:hypothetical protein [Candidatus Nanopelagicales bacterium]